MSRGSPQQQTHSESGNSSSYHSGSSMSTSQLYPLAGLIEDVLTQEGELWGRNETMLQTLRPNPVAGDTPRDSTDGVSMRSFVSSKVGSPQPGDDDNGDGLHLIKYGRLTKTIHKYFRKLEKRHACLHLTARKAKHDTLRHLERSVHSNTTGELPDLHSMSSAVAADQVDGRQVDLRDEERLVYRCALMCSQFPMLSAPEPPNGESPSPPLPPLPMKFDTGVLGSLQEDDLARTAPAECHPVLKESNDNNNHPPNMAMPNDIHDQEGSKSLKQSKRGKQISRTSSSGSRGSGKRNSDPMGEGVAMEDGLSESPDSRRKATQSVGVEGVDELDGRGKPIPTEPIAIKGTKSKVKTRSVKRSSANTSNTAGFTSSLAKLPAADSDEEDEMVTIMSSKAVMNISEGSGQLGMREHPFSPMVNREMLCNLVRRAFDQTEEQQLMFEQTLRQEYSRRSKGEILAKELAGQLQVLENNAHPFYKPKFFVTRNGYDIWLQAEKHRVKSLIDKFWHFSLPRPQLWRHYNPTDYHKAYSILLQKIICAESRTDRREPVHAGRTPSSPLSHTAYRLLTEFGLRYGVGELYRRIVYLDYLAKHFDYEIWYIKHCTEELQSIRNLLPRNRSKITAVRREMEMLRATVHLLHGQTDNSLTRIDRLFMDSDPREGVAALIELLAEVLDAEQSLFGKKVGPVDHWLKRYLKSGFVLRYERRKEIAADETVQSRTAQPFVLSPTLVNSLLLDIRDEIFEYRDKYQEVFRPYFDIVPFSKVEFYRLICADACSLCAGLLHRPETRQKMSLEMLGLMYRLNERDIEWDAVIPPELQLWRRHFSDLALVWMEVLAKQVNKWVVESIAQDQWILLSFSSPHTPPSRHPSPGTPFHSRRPSPKITKSFRTSPFPSPGPPGERRSAFTPSPFAMSRSMGAFSPYPSSGVMLRRTEEPPFCAPSEEGSGAVTDSSSNNTTTSLESGSGLSGNGVFIGGGIPAIMGQRLTEKSSGDSLLNFGQDGRQRSRGHGSQDDDDDILGAVDSVTSPAHEIQVSVSVYSGFESEIPRDSISPDNHTSSGHTSKEDQNDQEEDESEATEPIESSLIEKSPKSISESHATHSDSNVQPASNGRSVSGELKDNPLPEDVSPVDAQGDTEATQVPDSDPKVTVESELTSERDENEKGVVSNKKGVVSNGDSGEVDHPVDVNVTVLTREEFVNKSSSTNLPQINPSLSIEATDPPAPVIKFGNLLDSCKAGESDDPKAKVRIIKPSGQKPENGAGFSQWGVQGKDRQDCTAADQFHKPPASIASIGTVPELANWWKSHPSRDSVDVGRSQSTGASSISAGSSTTSPEPGVHLKGASVDIHSDDDDGITPVPKVSCSEEGVQNFLFPVSNSPIDIVTMLTRLACFTGSILNVLTPKLQRNAFQADDKPSHEYAPEVLQAREQAKLLWTNAENNRAEFLKKLHRIMLNALKLYADNILCMDLCCFSGVDAKKLVGEQKLQHLKRRKTAGDIWGCRHMVEAKHGLHPNGMPCQKKTTSLKFESITRDMCIRINNFHTLIKIFPSLENHLFSCMRTAIHHPVSALGYISSDPGELNSRRAKSSQSFKPNPHRTRTSLARGTDGILQVPSEHQKGTTSWPSSISPSLGPMEPDSSVVGSRGKRERSGSLPDVGFRSKESQQVLEYLQTSHNCQLRLLCMRMNKFFKPALSLLLELKLGDYPIDKRLLPLMTFLERHRIALQKYLYPECFSATMGYMWECILQDLETEAIQLRTQKRPVTDRAQMLLQTVSLMIEFMHNKNSGLPLDVLTGSSDYLLGLLDVMTRSTDQLITMFNKLSAPQFSRSHLDLSRAPVSIDPWVLQCLRSQLHRYKKCFSGKEFVDKVMEIGQDFDSRSGYPSGSETPTPGSDSHLSGRAGFSPVGQPVQFTVRYAKEVAQFLLNEGVLIQLPRTNSLSRSAPNPVPSTDEEVGFGASYESTHAFDISGRLRSGLSGSGTSSQGSFSSPNATPKQRREKNSGNTVRHALYNSYKSQEEGANVRGLAPDFSHSLHVFYKFADSEDADNSSLHQSQILAASSTTVRGTQTQTINTGSSSSRSGGSVTTSLRDEHRDFNNAKQGTLFFVYDLLFQRARKEKRAKQFLQLPRALEVVEQRRRRNVNCDLIFKM